MGHVREELGLVLRGQRELGRLLFERAPRLLDFLVLPLDFDVLLGQLLGLDASSSLVCCSSVCRVCSSIVSCCDCCSRFSVRIVASMVLSTTPIDWVSCSRNVRWVAVNGCSDESSMTAFVSPSNSTGSTTMFFGPRAAEAGMDAGVCARHLGQQDALLLERALADQAAADLDAPRLSRRRSHSRRAATAPASVATSLSIW